MNMPVTNSTFSTTQRISVVGNFGTNDPAPTKTTTTVPSEVQKRFDAAQVRLANAYSMPEGGPFGMFSMSRDNEIRNSRSVVLGMKQDFQGISSRSDSGNVPPEVRKAYENQQVRLADANAMPVFSSPFGGLFDGPKNAARQSAKDSMAGLEKDFPGLLSQPKTNAIAKGNPTGTTTDVPAGQAAANAAKISSVNNTKSGSAATGKPIDAATAEQAKSASGALGAYMHSNNIDTVDVNKLYAIANNGTGQVPEDVQKAAEFMVKNPDVYKAIETKDVVGADGISARNNFDKAAQGLVAFNEPSAATTAATPGTTPASTPATTTPGTPADTTKLSLAQQAKNASGTLAAYMRTDDLGSVDMNKLYAIANNSDCETSKDVSNAAAFMLKNPDMYRKIETNDVGGVDGISGLSNFENMAMGKIKMDAPTGSAAKGERLSKKEKNAPDAPVVAPKLTLQQEAKTSAGALAAYARTNNVELVDPNMLYSLSVNADKKATKEVQKAASFMLTHPDSFKRIETSQWAVVDGRASQEDLNRAAQGMTKFV
jgi:hypothetical protein